MERVVSLKVPQSLLEKLAATRPAGEAGAAAVGMGATIGLAWLAAAGFVVFMTAMIISPLHPK